MTAGPCKECPKTRECERGLACLDFAAFVETGRVMERHRDPSAHLFDAVMDDSLRLNWSKFYGVKRKVHDIPELIQGLAL